MKKILFAFFVLAAAPAFSQQKMISQAIINTTTNIIAPDDDDVRNLQGGNPGSGMNFRALLDGEIKSTTYLKNDMVKTVLKSEMGRSTIIRDNSKKLTTTLMEIMGNKTGFFITDEEQAEMRKKGDSMMQARRKTDTSMQKMPEPAKSPVEISYTAETKKIAGYTCKKAYVVNFRLLGIRDSVAVWYSPDIKLQNISSTGGLSGFGNMGTPNGIELIEGFVMAYEMNMRRNRKIQIEVTKIDLEKTVADNEFDIPKGFDIKPMKEMRNMFGGMMPPPGGGQ